MNEREIFQSAIDIPNVIERQAYLDHACGADSALRAQVELLLRSHEHASRFLETPAAEQLAPAAAEEVEATTMLPRSTPAVSPELTDDAVSLEFLEPSSKPGSCGRLAHYEVLEVLGRGAFGIVLKAFDEKLHRMVAIKVMNPELAATSPPRKRFLREAQSSAKIRHENIVAIHAVEEQPLPYLVMEYIPGGTLQQRLDQKGPLDIEDILRIGQQIALGLAAAHAQGLIHRDIKPANILIESGVEERAKITDFGLARATDDASMTQSGLIAGTPLYMAPEQAKGQPLDHRTDLFSLGSVLYTMASGRPPFRAANTIAVLKRVCEDVPRPITEVIPETPPWLCDIIAKLQAKEPDDRFQSAKEVADVMGQHLAHLRQPHAVPLPATIRVAITPQKREDDPPHAAALASLRGPARGLIATACLNWICLVAIFPISMWLAASSGGHFGMGAAEMLVIPILALATTVILLGGLKMLRGESYGWCVTASVMAMIIGPGYLLGWPFGIWSLFALSRPEVRAAFRQRGDAAIQRPRVIAASRPRWSPATILFAVIASVLVLPIVGIVLIVIAIAIPAYQAASSRIPVLPSERFQRGLQFDGKDDYVKVDGLNWAYPQFTLEAFVTSANDGDNGIIAMLQNGGPQSETMFLFDGPANSQRRVSGAGILGQKPFDNVLAPLSTGVRQHRALVFDGEVLHYFVNGKWQGKRHSTAKEGLQWNMHELWIGCKATETEFFRGTIDQVRVSRVARYTNSFPPVTKLQSDDKTLALYNFDEGAGDVLRDVSGNHHHAKIFGASWVQPRPTLDDRTPPVSNQWQPLFNGHDFTNWRPNDHWKIENGCMVSRIPQHARQAPAMLVTEQSDLRDFHVRIEAKINNGGDSGLFFRFGEQGNKAVHVQITAAPTAIGSLLRDVTTIVASTTTVRPDKWFTLEVIARGSQITVFVDGAIALRWADPAGEISTGPLAFESGFPGTEFMVRKIEIKAVSLDPDEAEYAWQPLFNGRDLTGWQTHPQQPGNWRVEDGAIVASGSVSHLFTKRDDFHDFEFRGEVRLNRDGNSGVFLRTPFAMMDPNAAVTSPPGYEVQLVTGTQVDPARMYLSGGVIPLANPNGANRIQQDRWHKFRVKAVGDKFETWIDDVQTVSAIDPLRKYQGGHIALQVWSAESKVEFRKLEVRNVSTPMEMLVDFNGDWDSVWGPVTLTHAPPNGDQPVELTGTYTLNGPASIRGTLDPKTRTFRGRFIQTAQEGRLQLKLSEDGKSIIGWYDYLLNEPFEKTQPRSSWNLTRQLPRVDFNGEWDSRFGVVTFTHGPISAPLPGPVNGTYYNGAGTIEGTVDPVTRQFIGIFHETNGLSGRIELKLSEDNAALSGSYAFAKNPDQKREWNMTRKGLPKSPPPAVAPFDAAQAKVHQEAWAKQLGVPVEYTNSLGMKFELIPPGEFLMGSPAPAIDKLSRELEQAGANDFEKFVARFSGPQHRVRITKPFYLGQHEVTVGQYRRFIANKKYLPTMQQLGIHRFKWEDSVAEPNVEDRAVVGISWEDADAFCHWVSDHTGIVTEIPTEAQWEYACRAGSETQWSFGDDPSQLSEHAVFGRPGFFPAEVVGSKKANPFGLFDMHGNADEWCRDWHDKDFYSNSPVDDPMMLDNPTDKNSGRVARGGTAHSAAWWTYSATRPWDFPATPNTPKGVRVMMSADAVRQALNAAPASPVSALEPENDWQSLFDGKSLSGWKSYPDQPQNWSVKNGAIVCDQASGYLFTDRNNFTNFHLRLEARTTAQGDAGILFGTRFSPATKDGMNGYEVQIFSGQPPVTGWNTGAIASVTPNAGWQLRQGSEMAVTPDEWFQIEVIAIGTHIETWVSGKKVAEYDDRERFYTGGHITLQKSTTWAQAMFRNMEVRPLP